VQIVCFEIRKGSHTHWNVGTSHLIQGGRRVQFVCFEIRKGSHTLECGDVAPSTSKKGVRFVCLQGIFLSAWTGRRQATCEHN